MKLVLVLAAALALVPAAAAAPPDVVTHENVDLTRTVGVCGFPVVVHSEGVFTDWQWFDESGALVRERAHVERAYTITWSNPANGKSISTVLGGPVFVEYDADGSYTQTVEGRERLFIARGDGPIGVQVGRLVYDVGVDGSRTIVTENGHWDLDLAPELCGYLA